MTKKFLVFILSCFCLSISASAFVVQTNLSQGTSNDSQLLKNTNTQIKITRKKLSQLEKKVSQLITQIHLNHELLIEQDQLLKTMHSECRSVIRRSKHRLKHSSF